MNKMRLSSLNLSKPRNAIAAAIFGVMSTATPSLGSDRIINPFEDSLAPITLDKDVPPQNLVKIESLKFINACKKLIHRGYAEETVFPKGALEIKEDFEALDSLPADLTWEQATEGFTGISVVGKPNRYSSKTERIDCPSTFGRFTEEIATRVENVAHSLTLHQTKQVIDEAAEVESARRKAQMEEAERTRIRDFSNPEDYAGFPGWDGIPYPSMELEDRYIAEQTNYVNYWAGPIYDHDNEVTPFYTPSMEQKEKMALKTWAEELYTLITTSYKRNSGVPLDEEILNFHQEGKYCHLLGDWRLGDLIHEAYQSDVLGEDGWKALASVYVLRNYFLGGPKNHSFNTKLSGLFTEASLSEDLQSHIPDCPLETNAKAGQESDKAPLVSAFPNRKPIRPQAQTQQSQALGARHTNNDDVITSAQSRTTALSAPSSTPLPQPKPPTKIREAEPRDNEVVSDPRILDPIDYPSWIPSDITECVVKLKNPKSRLVQRSFSNPKATYGNFKLDQVRFEGVYWEEMSKRYRGIYRDPKTNEVLTVSLGTEYTSNFDSITNTCPTETSETSPSFSANPIDTAPVEVHIPEPQPIEQTLSVAPEPIPEATPVSPSPTQEPETIPLATPLIDAGTEAPMQFELEGQMIKIPQIIEHHIEADLDSLGKALITIDAKTGAFFSVISLSKGFTDTASLQQIARASAKDEPPHKAIALTIDANGNITATKIFESETHSAKITDPDNSLDLAAAYDVYGGYSFKPNA